MTRVGKLANQSDSQEEQRSTPQGGNQGDLKSFAIATAATVAGNIITVMIIAVALILAHDYQPRPTTASDYEVLFGVTAIPFVAALMAFYFVYRSGKKKGHFLGAGCISYIVAALGVVFGFISLLYALVWLGFAAGIK